MEAGANRVRWYLLASAGLALLACAVLISNPGIERALLGHSDGSLRWGPALFRALLALHGALLMVIAMRGRSPAASGPTKPESAPHKRAWKPWLVLLLLSIVALGLRLWRLNSCLWFDEVITLLDFVRPSFGEIVTSFNSQNQHMLFSLLAHASVRIFGDSAWALRLPSVILGVGSLWPLYLLGRRLLGETEALFACALMTVSYHHIWFSQNARGYMGLLFFATLVTWLWLEALERNRFTWWAGYAAAMALGLWVHLTMLFVFAAHGVIHVLLLVHRRVAGVNSQLSIGKSIGEPIAAYFLCGTLTLQLYALSLPEFFRTAAHEGVAIKSDWTNPLWVVKEGLHGLQVGWSGALVLVCGAVLALAGYISIFRRDWRAALAMMLPGALGTVTMFALSHPLWPRFFFFSVGFALLIVIEGGMTVARVVTALLKRVARVELPAMRLGATLAAFMILASLLTLPRYYHIPKQDFTGARDYVQQNLKPGDAVVGVGLAGTAYSRYFAPQWLDAQTRLDLDKIRSTHPSLWLVYTIPAQLHSLDPAFLHEVQTDFKIVKVFPGTLGGGDILVCVPAHSRPPAVVSENATAAKQSAGEQ